MWAMCPFAFGHYIENTGDEPLVFLEMFRSPYFADLSLNQWMALTTPKLVQTHLINMPCSFRIGCDRERNHRKVSSALRSLTSYSRGSPVQTSSSQCRRWHS